MHRTTYTITFPDEEDMFKDFPLMSSLMKSRDIPTSPRMLSPPSNLYQQRRNYYKMEKQKTDENQPVRLDTMSSPNKLYQQNKNNNNCVADKYEIKKPHIEWDKENQLNSGNKFYQRLSHDVTRRQGNLPKHQDYLRKSTCSNMTKNTQIQLQIHKTIDQISMSQNKGKTKQLLVNLKQHIDQLFEQLQEGGNGSDVSRQFEELEQIREYYQL